jgi:hypothetical protein
MNGKNGNEWGLNSRTSIINEIEGEKNNFFLLKKGEVPNLFVRYDILDLVQTAVNRFRYITDDKYQQ